MPDLRRSILALTLLFAVTAAAFADTMPKDLADTYQALDKAMRTLNFKAFSAAFDEDFILVDPEGKTMNRKGFMAMVQPMFGASRSATSTIKMKRVSVSGDYAEVQFDMHLQLMGKAGTTKVHEIGSDFWVKKNGKWLLYRTVDEKLEMAGAGG